MLRNNILYAVKQSELLVKVFKNKALQYLFSRYLTYFIQFVNSILMSVYLGPYYLGIWGFINLVVQYFAQINFGIASSVNTIASIEKKNDVVRLMGSGLSMLVGLSVVSLLFFLGNFWGDWGIGAKYHFNDYMLLVAGSIIFGHFTNIFASVYRIYGKLFEISFSQTIGPIFNVVAIVFFRGKALLDALVWSNFIAAAVSILFFIVRSPIRLQLNLDGALMKKIQLKGLSLFLYSTSFYLVIITTKSFVSTYYPVTDFGYFTFSYSLGNVILLLLQSIAFMILPKILYKFSQADHKEGLELLTRIRNNYIGLSHLLIHIVVCLFPIFLLFFPKYASILLSFRLVALTMALYTNSFGFQGLIIAKGKTRQLGWIAFMALAMNVALAYCMASWWHCGYSYLILATMVTYFFYTWAMGFYGLRLTGEAPRLWDSLWQVFPFRMLLPFGLSLVMTLCELPAVFLALPLIVYVLMNGEVLVKGAQTFKELVRNPQIIDIK